MPLSIYQLSIPTFLRGLAIAGGYCRKASAFCTERGISPLTLIDARLAPDMLTFAGPDSKGQRYVEETGGAAGRH